MKAYKGFNKNEDGTLSCQGFVYEPGKTYKHEGKIEICESGFHACHELWQIWPYYPNNGENVFYEVECGGDMIESKNGDGKFVCSEMRLVKEMDMTDVAMFDNAHFYKEGFVAIRQGEKYNHINKDGVLLSEQWFDCTWTFNNGAALVKLNHQFNFIGKDGKLLYETWFDEVFLDRKGICIINSDKECWRIDKNWNIIK